MTTLTQATFNANIARLSRTATDSVCSYDPAFLDALRESAKDPADSSAWTPFAAFREVARFVLQGPLDSPSVLTHVGHKAGVKLSEAAKIQAQQIMFRLGGLMAAFSPAHDATHDPGALISISERDYYRVNPFIESIQRHIAAQGDAGRIDIVDVGCGPHAFWAVFATSLDPRVRVCAIEKDPVLARQAQAFVQALGLEDRIHVLRLDAVDPAVDIQAAVTGSFGGGFAPSLIVSETVCALLLSESADQILRRFHAAFPAATLVPSAVEFVATNVDLAIPVRRQPLRLYAAGVVPIVSAQDTAAPTSLGIYRPSDVGIATDEHGRRLVGPFQVRFRDEGAESWVPIVGTRVHFPHAVAALEPGASALTAWLWPSLSPAAIPFFDRYRTMCTSTPGIAPFPVMLHLVSADIWGPEPRHKAMPGIFPNSHLWVRRYALGSNPSQGGDTPLSMLVLPQCVAAFGYTPHTAPSSPPASSAASAAGTDSGTAASATPAAPPSSSTSRATSGQILTTSPPSTHESTSLAVV